MKKDKATTSEVPDLASVLFIVPTQSKHFSQLFIKSLLIFIVNATTQTEFSVEKTTRFWDIIKKS